jgi:prophage regulatory protein
MVDRGRDNLLRFTEMTLRTKISSAGLTPAVSSPIQLSAGLVAWYESDIDRGVNDAMGWHQEAYEQ